MILQENLLMKFVIYTIKAHNIGVFLI